MEYEEVIRKLNSCIIPKPANTTIEIKDNLEVMKFYLKRVGITNEILNKLSVVHVTGTKGKGSTSAFCESILREHGYETGFLSSPHLVTPRERIRINGQMISKETFVKYFHEVYSLLDSSKVSDHDVPSYYALLTCMAFKVFIEENLEVVVLEVSVGGISDYTNVVRNVPSVGISPIAIDHVEMLGDTKEKIALAKSGIMKPGCTAYTVHQQPSVLDVLKTTASQTKCLLHVVPAYEDYEWGEILPPQLPSPEMKMNASLAIQLAHCWMDQHRRLDEIIKEKNSSPNESQMTVGGGIVKVLPRSTALGLTSCRWPGRYQTIHLEYADLYLDGAHTVESIAACVNWYTSCTSESTKRALLFNTSFRKNPLVFMDILINVDFEEVFFTPIIASRSVDPKHGQFSIISKEQQMEGCEKSKQYWEEWSRAHEEKCSKTFIFDYVSDALEHLEKDFLSTRRKFSVLITGSLHLVGAVLTLVEPELS